MQVSSRVPDFHENYGQLFQIEAETGEGRTFSKFSPVMKDMLVSSVPEIREAVILESRTLLFEINGRSFYENVIFTEPEFFDLFSFNVSKGNPASVLATGKQMLITPEKAKKWFGTENPLGEQARVQLGSSINDIGVAGMLEPYHYKSRLQPDIVMPVSFLDNYFNCGIEIGKNCLRSITILGNGAASRQAIEASVNQNKGLYREYFAESGGYEVQDLSVEPLFAEIELRGAPFYGFVGITFIVLLLSCVNYINNTIAVTSTRMKEIGIRKVFGIKGRGIAIQFLAETLVATFLALVLSILLLGLFQPFIDLYLQNLSASGFTFTLDPLFQPSAMLFILVLMVLTALIAGLYPALYISGLDPSSILTNKLKTGRSSIFSRFLVGFQLAFSMILLVLVLNIRSTVVGNSRQIYGIATEDIWRLNVTNSADGKSQSRYSTFRAIAGQSSHSFKFGGIKGSVLNPPFTEIERDRKTFESRIYQVDAYFLNTLEMSFRAGESHPVLYQPVVHDSSYAVINEVLAKQMSIDYTGGDPFVTLQGNQVRIVGVVEEFTGFRSRKNNVPAIFLLTPDRHIETVVVNAGDTGDSNRFVYGELKEMWTEAVGPGLVYHPAPLPDPMDEFRLILKFAQTITFIALLFTFIGLFSLTNFSVTKRLKEISIRKVNGATPGQIVRLLVSDYLKTGLIAFIIALPLGYISSNMVLSVYLNQGGNFFLLFFISVASLLLFVLSSVAYQVYYAAGVNPVRYLKDE